jgi:hypothetical protein
MDVLSRIFNSNKEYIINIIYYKKKFMSILKLNF